MKPAILSCSNAPAVCNTAVCGRMCEVAEGIVDREGRFALCGLKHRCITNCEGKAPAAMRQLYDYSAPVIEAVVRSQKAVNFPGNFPAKASLLH